MRIDSGGDILWLYGLAAPGWRLQMPGKIFITREELTSTATDRKVHRQELAGRSLAATRVQPGPMLAARLFYNALFYTTVAGCLAGIAAWLCGEFIDAAIPNHAAECLQFMDQSDAIIAAGNSGRISPAAVVAELASLRQTYSRNPFVLLQMNKELPTEVRRARFHDLTRRAQYHNFLQKVCWFSCVGMIFASVLASVEHVVSRNFRAVVVSASSGAVVGLIAGVAVSLSIDWLYHAIQGDISSGPPSMARQMMARSIAWGVFGSFLAMAPGVASNSLKRMLLGATGGLTGGLIGGLLFDPVAFISDGGVVSRLVGLAAIGTLAGLCSGLFENAARTGWLQVKAGLIAGKQFILYHNPVILGSSPACEVYLFKDPCIAPRHAAIVQTPGGFHIEEIESHTGVYVNGARVKRASLQDGDEIQTGGALFVFRQRATKQRGLR